MHTPYDEQRNNLVPINKRWPIEEVLNAGAFYSERKNRKTVLTYMLIPNENDSPAHTSDLAELVDSNNFSIQLTCLNSPTPNEENYNSWFKNTSFLFAEILNKKGKEYDIQTSKGIDIDGGCGQLSTNINVSR